MDSHRAASNLLFIAGFWHSGAFAVWDYLKASHSCCDPFPDIEPSFFRDKYTIYSLYSALDSDRDVFVRELLMMFSYNIMNIKLPVDNISDFINSGTGALRYFSESQDKFMLYLGIFDTFCREVLYAYSKKDKQLFRQSVKMFFNNMAGDAITDEHKYILLCNTISASRLACLRQRRKEARSCWYSAIPRISI